MSGVRTFKKVPIIIINNTRPNKGQRKSNQSNHYTAARNRWNALEEEGLVVLLAAEGCCDEVPRASGVPRTVTPCSCVGRA